MRKIFTLLFICITLCVTSNSFSQVIHYVNDDASGTNDGTSWANAFNSLQDALDVAVEGDQIWVAEGLYKPSKDVSGNNTPADPRTKTFFFKSGVNLYGGFTGIETAIEQSEPFKNKTILSGDLNEDDEPNFVNNTENNYNVAVAANLSVPTTIQGFHISHGNANLSSSRYYMGGGLFSDNNESSLTLKKCLFSDNWSFYGGGVYSNSKINNFIDCIFIGNKAQEAGGGLISWTTLNIINSVFYNNNSKSGGGIYVANRNATITNCTLAKNSAVSGAAIMSQDSTEVFNTIVYGNTSYYSRDIDKISGAIISVENSNIEKDYNFFPGYGNIHSDPLFVNINDPDGPDNIWATPDDGLSLQVTSPSANSGDNTVIPSGVDKDILGDNRILDDTVNMGAYEYVVNPNIIYVDIEAAGAGDGTSWPNAFTNLQEALDIAVAGNEIWVTAGQYIPSKEVESGDPRSKSFVMVDGVSMYGGFEGSETRKEQRKTENGNTILSGDINGDDGADFVGIEENVHHVVSSNGFSYPVMLDRFVITGGNANVASPFFGMADQNRYGGGLYITGPGRLKITNCVFEGNKAVYGAGAYNNSDNIFVNCIFYNNEATYGGAAMNNYPTVKYLNCTFNKNRTAGLNNGPVFQNTRRPDVKNSVFWDTGGSLFAGTDSDITYSLTYSIQLGTGNVKGDPFFVNAENPIGVDGIWGTEDDGLRLHEKSLGANSGSNEDIPFWVSSDLSGNPRILDDRVNMGAYEKNRPTEIVYVDIDATGVNDGSSWENAYNDLQHAINFTKNGDEVWVAEGIYTPTADIYSNNSPDDLRTRTFRLKSKVQVYGGFKGGETILLERDFRRNATILSGDFNGDDLPGFVNYTENAYHVVSAIEIKENGTLLDGFYIESGNANGTNSIYSKDDKGNGAGIFLYKGLVGPEIKNSVIRNNKSTNGGGVAAYHSHNMVFENVIVTNNNASDKGGGFFLTYCSGTTLSNSLVSDNSAYFGGGGIFADHYLLKINGSTIAGNIIKIDYGYAAGLHVVSSNQGSQSHIEISNTIIYFNSPGANYKLGANATAMIHNSNISGLETSADPLFYNPADPDGADNLWGTVDDGYSLQKSSPSVNTGDNSVIPFGITTDITGNVRILDSIVNIGAYEVLNNNFQTISFEIITDKSYGDPSIILQAIASSGLPVSFELVSGLASLNGDTLTIIGAGNIEIKASQEGNEEYDAAMVSQSFTVVPALLTVSTDDAEREYGNENPIFTGKLEGIKNGDSIALNFECAATALSPSGNYVINPEIIDPNNRLLNYNVTISTGTLTITKAGLSVTVDNVQRAYGDSNPSFKGILEGIKNNDNITLDLSTGTTETSPVGIYPISVNFADADNKLCNYNVQLIPATMTITKAAITARADNKERLYGDANPQLTGTFEGVKNGENISMDMLTNAALFSNVGVYEITPVLIDPDNKLSNYEVTIEKGALTIGKADLSITVDSKQKTYGESNPELTGTLAGLKDGDYISVSFSTVATELSNVGSYEITPIIHDSFNKKRNYELTIINGDLIINKAVLTAIVDNKIKEYGDENPPLTGAVTGIKNGDDLTLSISTSADFTSTVGTYDLIAEILDPTGKLSNYAVTITDGVLIISKAELKVSVDNKERLYGDENPLLSGTLDGKKNNDNLTLDLLTTANVNSPVGTYDISINMTDPDNRLDNYSVTSITGTLTVRKAPLTAKADYASQTYGSKATLMGSLNGVRNNDKLELVLTTAANELTPVGNRVEITASVSDPDGRLDNYELNIENADVTVLKATLIITADDYTITYGDPIPDLTYTLSGFVNGETSAVLEELPSIVVDTGGADVAGDYNITLSGGLAANYDLFFQNGILTIEKAVADIVITNLNQIFDGSAKTVTVTTSPSGLTYDVVYDGHSTPPSAVGSYEVIVTITDPNYLGSEEAELEVKMITSINDKVDMRLMIYPNPVLNSVKIKSEKDVDDVKLSDAAGKSFSFAYSKLEDTITLDLTNVPAGNYYILIYISGEIYVHKINKL